MREASKNIGLNSGNLRPGRRRIFAVDIIRWHRVERNQSLLQGYSCLFHGNNFVIVITLLNICAKTYLIQQILQIWIRVIDFDDSIKFTVGERK